MAFTRIEPIGSSTFSGDPGLTLTVAASRIVPGATSLSLRNNANNADNLILTDAGAATIRAGLTVTAGGVTVTSGTTALGANNLTMTGTISATGARVTQSYHTNITSTNAVTVDSSLQSKVPESIYDYQGDALAILRGVRVIGYRHHEYLDASNRVKLGVVAETVAEPLALSEIARPEGGTYPGVNLMGLLALQTRALQQADARIAALEARGG